MPRQIRISVIMNGEKIDTIEMMRNHFSLKEALQLYANKKLQLWLRVHRYPEILAELEQLDDTAPDFSQRLCDTLGTECIGDFTLSDIRYEEEKKQRLSALTDNPDLLSKADSIALNQDDLEYIYRSGNKKIILYSGLYTIDPSYTDVTYSRRNAVQVIIPAMDNLRFADCNITFEQIPFGWDVSGITEQDEVYQAEQMMMSSRWKDALPILEKYAAAQHPRALMLLEIYYQNDCKKRNQYRNAGCALGSVQSGILSQKTENELKLLALLADKGDALSKAICGVAYLKAGNTQDGTEYLHKSAENGCIWAAYMLGLEYEKMDAAQSEQWLRKAADSGYLPAVIKIALLPSTSDEERARMLAAAKEQGCTIDPKLLFDRGEEFLQSGKFEEAVEQYKQAAGLGYAPAQMRLGCCYLNGKGVAQNISTGMDYCKQAKQQGDNPAAFAIAMVNLFMLRNAQEAEKNVSELARIGNQGYGPACIILSDIYRIGLCGTPKNQEYSKHWLQEAKKAGMSRNENFSANSLYALPRDDSSFSAASLEQDAQKGIDPGLLILERIFCSREHSASQSMIDITSKAHAPSFVNSPDVILNDEEFSQLVNYLGKLLREKANSATTEIYTQGHLEIKMSNYPVTLKMTVRLYGKDRFSLFKKTSSNPLKCSKIVCLNILMKEAAPQAQKNNKEATDQNSPQTIAESELHPQRVIQGFNISEAEENVYLLLKRVHHPNSTISAIFINKTEIDRFQTEYSITYKYIQSRDTKSSLSIHVYNRICLYFLSQVQLSNAFCEQGISGKCDFCINDERFSFNIVLCSTQEGKLYQTLQTLFQNNYSTKEDYFNQAMYLIHQIQITQIS